MKNYLMLIPFIVFTMTVGAQIPFYVPANGLSAWYSFDENTNDESGNNNHLLGTADSTAGHFYSSSAVTNFQASDPLICDSTSFIFGRDSSFTLSCWIKSTDSIFGGLIVKHWNKVTSDDFDWFFGLNNSSISFACGGYSSAWTICKYEENIAVDSWMHLVASYDSGAMKLFLNTELVASENFTDSATTSQLIFRVGHDPWNNTVLANVNIDDMGIWTRILSASELQDLYDCVLGVDNLIAEDKILLYPNPSKGKMVVEIKNVPIAFKEDEIRIYNTNGENIYYKKLHSDKTQIDLSREAKGIYFIKIKTGKTIQTKKFIIE